MQFDKFGPIAKVWIARNPPGFGKLQYRCSSSISGRLLLLRNTSAVRKSTRHTPPVPSNLPPRSQSPSHPQLNQPRFVTFASNLSDSSPYRRELSDLHLFHRALRDTAPRAHRIARSPDP